MTSQVLARSIWKTVLGCAALVSALSVHAGAFVTNWDPEFNLAFSTNIGDLGWKGQAVVTVDDACVSQGGTTSVAFPQPWWGNCNSANLDSLDLTFYDVSSGDNLLPTFHLVNPNTNILAIESANNAVSGIFTFPWLKFDNVEVYGHTIDFWLLFTFDGPILKAQEDCYAGSQFSYSTTISSKQKCHPPLYVSANPNDPEAIKNGTAPKVVWSRVPEPGSLVLVGLAAGVLGLISRRRRQAR